MEVIEVVIDYFTYIIDFFVNNDYSTFYYYAFANEE